MNLLTFILACYGMTMILVYSKIFEVLRNKLNSLKSELLSYMLKCCMCMGFWVGIFISLVRHILTSLARHFFILLNLQGLLKFPLAYLI